MKTNWKRLYQQMTNAYNEQYYRFQGYQQAVELFVKREARRRLL